MNDGMEAAYPRLAANTQAKQAASDASRLSPPAPRERRVISIHETSY